MVLHRLYQVHQGVIVMQDNYQDHNIDRQPQTIIGGIFGPFQPGQFFPPGQGPGFFPPGQGPGAGQPPGRPPAFVPQQATGVFAVDPGGIRRCMFRYVYIWLDNGQQFWAWLVFVGRNSVAGWRWIGFRWVWFGIDLNRITSFFCL